MDTNNLDENILSTNSKIVMAVIGVVVIGAILWAASTNNSGSTSATSTLTTAYTNTTANVRSCGATNCNIVGTYPPNTSVDVSTYGVTSVAQLPDWISFSYTATNGSSATGYVNKTVLSGTQVSASSTSPVSGQSAQISQQTQSAPSFTNQNLPPSVIAQIEPTIVEINCYSYDDTIESSGSGISYLPKNSDTNYIETNYHVYTGAIVNGQSPTCYAVFPQPPDFSFNSSYGDYQLTLEGWHYNPNIYEDSAVFAIGKPIPSSIALSSIPTIEEAYNNLGISTYQCSDTDASVGDSVTVFGYPNSGNLLGISETVTEGIISGIIPGPIYKTNAGIDHGNSGGAAILNKKGCALGIPTLGESGLTAGIGYIQSYTLAKKAIQ